MTDTRVARRSVRERFGAMLVSSGSLLSDRDVRGFWRGRFKAGLAVQGVVSLSALGYLFLTPDGPNRLALKWLVAACVGLTVVGVLMLPRITGWILRPRFWMGWLVGGCAVICLIAGLDGGLDSPLLLAPLLPVLAAALVATPGGLAACMAVALTGIVVVGATDLHSGRGAAGMLMMLLLLVTGAGLFGAGALQRGLLQSRMGDLLSELNHRVTIDDLTGCHNRAAFHPRLRLEVDRAFRYSRPVSLLLCDIDRFKVVNDSYGHASGDAVLAVVGARLRSVVRSVDVAARIGGDEFAVILPETTAAEALVIAARVVEGLVDSRGDEVSLSIGVAQLRPEDPSSERLFADADAALYQAKGRALTGTETTTATEPAPVAGRPR